MKDVLGKKGLVLNIQRLSTEDGPGLRTTVFFKGCPLRCAWCHNPESISSSPQVHWLETRCITCHTCLQACPLGVLTAYENAVLIDQGKCNGCGDCSRACPSGAMELLGREYKLDDLVSELIKDRAFFESSDQGGITLSGGEPTLQYEFIYPLLKKLNRENLHTALDTCGVCDPDKLMQLLPLLELVLYDLKLQDNQAHHFWTGGDNRIILENLIKVGEYIRTNNGWPKLWLRTPLIPGATADEKNLQALGDFISSNLADVVERWELCAFNNLCRDKYRRLGMNWDFNQSILLNRNDMEHFEQIARSSVRASFSVAATGAARIEQLAE